MGIREFLNRLREKKAKYKEYAEARDIEDKYEQRQKSANERELERYMNEQRELAIKKELEQWRKAKQKEAQFENQIIQVKNIFEPKYNKVSVLKSHNVFTNEKKLFSGQRRVI